MIGIVVSRADEASLNIGEQLLELAEWETVEDGVYRREEFELREFDALHLDLDRVATAFEDPEYLVVAARHSGETGALLSAHFTGNFGTAEYGGADRELSEPCPNALKHVLAALAEYAPPDYDVAMECTHHGPTDLGAPSMFVELGSGEEQWDDPEGARAVARAILDLEGVAPTSDRTIVAFGGNHYAPRPTRIVLETDYAVGHVAPDWGLEDLGDPTANADLIASVFDKSGATCAVLDGDLPAVEESIHELGYRVVSETWLRETSGYSLDFVDEIESALGTIESGVRIGADATAGASFEILELPEELVDECHSITSKDTLEAVRGHTVAYETEENGNRLGRQGAFATTDAYDELVDRLCDILETAYDTVRREADVVVAERRSFDPQLAAEQGVPEGPKFGTLAAGESVTVDGTTVEPADVRSPEIRRFDVRRSSDGKGER